MGAAARQAPQFFVSLVLHVLMLVALVCFSMTPPQPAQVVAMVAEMSEEMIEEFQQDLVPDEELDLNAAVALTSSSASGKGIGNAGGGGGGGGPPAVKSNSSKKILRAIGDSNLNRPLAGAVGKLALNSNITGLKGIDSFVGAGGDTGVVDRITQEIMAQLQKSKVLVVWIFDASLSLTERREKIAQRFERIYTELEELGANQSAALLTGVVGVGEKTSFLLDKPSNEVAKIRKAIRAIKEDKSGTENLFGAIRQVCEEYRGVQRAGKRTLMIVLMTDEIGDDEKDADKTLETLQRQDAVLYIMGPIASFSRPVYHDVWTDPATGFHFYPPLKRGPYTREEEFLRVPFHATPYLSGFGPFALTQVTRETGGIFFIYNDDRIRLPTTKYDAEILAPYKANYGNPKVYADEIRKSPLRQELMKIVREGNGLWRVHWPDHWIYYKYVRRELTAASDDVGRFLKYAEKAIPALEDIEKKELSKETHVRWRANFDLTYARMLHAKVRADEMVWANDDFLQMPRLLKDAKKNNGWWYRLLDNNLLVGQKTGLTSKEREALKTGMKEGKIPPKLFDPKKRAEAEAMAAKARDVFARIIKEHPGTPWAAAAQHEMRLSLRGDWIEGANNQYIDDPERRRLYEEAAKRMPKK